ncbi:hypothetical protein D3C84_1031030 [compost metagenome]
MQVDEGLVEELRIAAKRLQIRADVAVGNFRRLLHHVAQLPGEFETTVERVNPRRFNRQCRAAHAGPGQPSDHAGTGQHLLIAEHRVAE